MKTFKKFDELDTYYSELLDEIKGITDGMKQPTGLQTLTLVDSNIDIEALDENTRQNINCDAIYWAICDAITKAWKYDTARLKHKQTAQNTAKNMTKAERMARSQKANEVKKAKAEARKNGHHQDVNPPTLKVNKKGIKWK